MSWARLIRPALEGTPPPSTKRKQYIRYDVQEWTLTTGEVLTTAQLLKDKRNVRKRAGKTLRSRLYKGIRDPEELFA